MVHSAGRAGPGRGCGMGRRRYRLAAAWSLSAAAPALWWAVIGVPRGPGVRAGTQSAVRADVIVVTWQARDLTARCLECLAPQVDAGGHRLVVVDNASSDGTGQLIRERFSRAELIELPSNIGFGRAVNAGAAGGTGEAIVLVNNDVFAEAGFLEALLRPLGGDATIGMVAGMTLMPDQDPPLVDAFGIELDPTLTAYNRLRHRSPDSGSGLLAGPSGGAAAYRRSAWE